MDTSKSEPLNQYESLLEERLASEIAVATARNPAVSEIFYYFEAVTDLRSGRTVGRKIGVVQEIVLRKYLSQSPELMRRMYLEQRLTGFSGASHKVEFSWYAIRPMTLAAGAAISGTDFRLLGVDSVNQEVTLGYANNRKTRLVPGVPVKGAARKLLDDAGIDLRLRHVVDGSAAIDLVDKKDLLASLESKRVGAQRFSATDKIGAGIQTIEKAKQASLVAIDLDIAFNGSTKPLESAESSKRLLSFVALGNGVHWTTKDRAVLGAYVDYTFLVPDRSIIRYAEYVRGKCPPGSEPMEHFMSYFGGMTIQTDDDFEVSDDDFTPLVPSGEARTLKEILEQHIIAVNP